MTQILEKAISPMYVEGNGRSVPRLIYASSVYSAFTLILKEANDGAVSKFIFNPSSAANSKSLSSTLPLNSS